MKSKTDAFLDEINKSLSEDTSKKKAKQKAKTVRGCIFEVCQDLDAFDIIPDFDKCAESTGAVQYMWKVHDHDVYGEDDRKVLQAKGLDISKYPLGAPKNDHVHIYLRFKNPVTLPKIAKAFGVPKQNVQLWKGANAWGNAVSYLVHRTPGAENKYQYDPATVHANFDYVQALAEVTENVAVANARKSKSEIEDKFEEFRTLYALGKFSFKELKRRLASDPGIMKLAAKKKRELDALHELVDDQEAQKFYDTFTQSYRVIWLYGDTGSGKSLAAKYMAKQFAKKRFPDEPPLDNSYQILGSSRGPFEQYSASVHCVILDDFRPSKSFSLDDLFRNLDPHKEGETFLPGRYYDRKLAAGIVIITSSYDPAEFGYRAEKVWSKIPGDLQLQKNFKIPIDAPAPKPKIDLSKVDAIKKAWLKSQVEKDDGSSTWTKEQIKEYCKSYSWNTCDSPAQNLRRITVYNVRRDANDAVLFQRMRPIEHDNGYCEYEKDSVGPNLSLEEVWECASLDFNPANLSSYNYYNRNFDLNYHDQTLSEEADFLMRCRKTYLYIHGGAPSRYLDAYHDPEIEVKQIYDKQAFEAIQKKVAEDDDHRFDDLIVKIKKQLDAM